MRIHLIGCGAMGSSMARSLAHAGHELFLYDKESKKRETLAKEIKAKASNKPLDHYKTNDWLILAVKPESLTEVAKELTNFKDGLLCSLLMGVSVKQLQEFFPSTQILRMMPNLAVEHDKGVVALSDNLRPTPLAQEIEKTFSSLGYLHWFSESKFGAVTALTGSGPAFMIALIEAMIESSIAMGLNAQEGAQLTLEMVEGALSLLKNNSCAPEELRRRIASPGGSTIAGLRAFEAQGVRSGLIETFLASYARATQ